MIDFADPRNLIFFAIVLIFAAIVIAIFFIILRSIFRLIKNIFRKLFIKKSVTQKQLPKTQNPTPHLQPQYTQRERSFLSSKQTPLPINEVTPSKPAVGPVAKVDKKQEFEEKSKKDIEAELAELKTSGSADKQTLGSKMPSRETKTEEENIISAKIEIPKAPKFRAEKQPQQTKGAIEQNQPSKIPSQISADIPAEHKNIDDYLEKPPDVLKDILETKSLEEKSKEESSAKTNPQTAKKNQASQPSDSSIFEGKEEISRIKLRHKMRYDPKVWKAQKDFMLNISREEREKLINDLFPSVYGRNISKKDLSQVIKRMGRQWSSATDMNKKANLRKEIKFLKKIGGIS